MSESAVKLTQHDVPEGLAVPCVHCGCLCEPGESVYRDANGKGYCSRWCGDRAGNGEPGPEREKPKDYT